MLRRDALRGAGTLVALALAGCADDGEARDGGSAPPEPPPTETTVAAGDPFTTTSPTPDPVPNLTVDGVRPEASDGGDLVLLVDVRNLAGEESSGVLIVSVRVGDETYERERLVTVAGDGTETVEFEYPTSLEAFLNDGAVDFDWRSAPEE